MSSKNIELEQGFEIISRPSVRQMDQVNLVYRKYDKMIIGEMEMTLEMAKILIVDKTKIGEIDAFLDGELDEKMIDRLNSWGEKMLPVVASIEEDAKKKGAKPSSTTKEQ